MSVPSRVLTFPASPAISILRRRLRLLQLMTLPGHGIGTQSVALPLGFTLRVAHSLGFDKCVMLCAHPCGSPWNRVTAPEIRQHRVCLFAVSDSWLWGSSGDFFPSTESQTKTVSRLTPTSPRAEPFPSLAPLRLSGSPPNPPPATLAPLWLKFCKLRHLD